MYSLKIIITIPVTIKAKTIENIIKVINYEKFKSILCKEKWTNVFNSNSVNVCLLKNNSKCHK